MDSELAEAIGRRNQMWRKKELNCEGEEESDLGLT